MADNSSRNVFVRTFLKWNTGGVIRYNTTRDGQKVSDVWCSLCAKHSEMVKRDRNIRGAARLELDKYIMGTNFVCKHSVFRHLSSKAHMCAKGYEDLLGVGPHTVIESEIQHSEAETGAVSKPHQPRIDSAFNETSKEAYRKLMKTAYLMAVTSLPFAHFRTLVNVQKANGVKLLSKTEDSTRACEFMAEIVHSMKKKITEIIQSSVSFSILTDGSQARKTNSEKELVLLRVVRDGKPIFICAALQDIDSFGDADAANLKTAVDDVFKPYNLDIGEDTYMKKVVSFTSDGASVNTGIHNGLLTRMRNDNRPWLVSIHCVLHRLELAIKDSLMKIPQIEAVKEFMVSIYYMFKQSGKLKRHFESMAKILNVQAYCFPKVHGTRFVGHQRRGLEHLLHNWIVLAQTIEDCIETKKLTTMSAKLQGVLKKLKDLSFLSTCVQYLNILESVSQMSLKLEQESTIITEVVPCVEKTKARLEELVAVVNNTEAVDLVKPFGFQVKLSEPDKMPVEYTVEKTVLKRGHMKSKPSNREHITLSMQGLTGVSKTAHVKVLVAKAVEDTNICLDHRFSSFQTPLFEHMHWLNPANWVDFEKDLNSVEILAEHFEETLAFSGFDRSRLKLELKDLRLTVKHFYQGIEATALWSKILLYRKSEFPNICKLAEILLCLGPSNSLVENGFSALTNMLTDRRLSLSHRNMENALLIKINDQIWCEKDREDLIESAVTRFISQKRRKMKLDTSSSYSVLSRYKQKRSKRKGLSLNSVSECEEELHLANDSSESETESDLESSQESVIMVSDDNEGSDSYSSEEENAFQTLKES